jgi:beta-glucosidase
VNPDGSGDWKVEFDVTNCGERQGAEVAQVYVGEVAPKVEQPVRELKGFQKLHLAAGETRHVVIQLNPRTFAHFDPTPNEWVADAGAYRIQVGDSSVELPLETRVTIHQEMRLQ